MKILLTGGTGLLGTSLARIIDKKKHELTITFLKNKPNQENFNSVKMDLSDTQEIKKIISELRPELIIHTAASTNMEWCEANPAAAFQINSGATEATAEKANEIGAKVVYISTDFVFDGQRGNYKEVDQANPLNIYGESKLKGELAVLKYQKNLVVRTNIYGIDPPPDKQSFASFILNNLRAGKQVTAADDQFCNQIFADDLSKLIMEAAESQSGILHLTSKDPMSRYEFAMQACDVFGLDKALVKKAKLVDLVSMFKWKAKRPYDTSMDVSKAGKSFKLPTTKASLEHFKSVLEKGSPIN